MRVIIKMRSYKYKGYTMTKERPPFREEIETKVLYDAFASRLILRARALPFSKCSLSGFFEVPTFLRLKPEENGDLKIKQARFQIRIRHRVFTRCERARGG